MGICADTEAYEAWLRQRCDVVEADLDHKHDRMKEDAFIFLRATYYRWARQIAKICPEMAKGPRVLAVGDAHVENFGTWRDHEGRLVWGVNDFDDAAIMPYALDLVRLATSARLSSELPISRRAAADHIVAGYRRGLEAPRPILLDEQETWMRPWVACSDQDRRKFWREIKDYPSAVPPDEVARGLIRSLPSQAKIIRFASRSKGGGGLGRPRFVAIAVWRGGQVVREAKALVPSAWDWAHGVAHPVSRTIDAATGTYRSPDPHLSVKHGFVFRRIAADSRKVELGEDAGEVLHAGLLHAMGFDLGSIHAADAFADSVRDHLDERPDGWLHKAAKAAASAVQADYDRWCETFG